MLKGRVITESASLFLYENLRSSFLEFISDFYKLNKKNTYIL